MSEFLNDQSNKSTGSASLQPASYLDFQPTERERALREWLFRDVLASPAYEAHLSWVARRLVIDGFELPFSQVRGFFSTSAQIIVETKELTSAGTFDFQNIPDRYKHLRLILYLRSAAAVTLGNVYARFNADTGANYYTQYVVGAGAGASASEILADTKAFFGVSTGASATANLFAASEVLIPFYNSSNKKDHTTTWHGASGTGSGTGNAGTGGGWWNNTGAINRIQVANHLFGNFDTGSIATLYAHN